MTHMTAEAILVCNLRRFSLKLEGREINSAMGFYCFTQIHHQQKHLLNEVGRLKHVDLRYLWIQDTVLCAAEVASSKESWDEEQRCRFEHKEFECGKQTLLVWFVWFIRRPEEDYYTSNN